MNQENMHENQAGVTIKLCFNSKRFLQKPLQRETIHAEGMSDFLFNFLRVVGLFVQLIKWLHETQIKFLLKIFWNSAFGLFDYMACTANLLIFCWFSAKDRHKPRSAMEIFLSFHAESQSNIR